MTNLPISLICPGRFSADVIRCGRIQTLGERQPTMRKGMVGEAIAAKIK